MSTSIGKEDSLVDTLKHLIALDYDAISAYQAAVDRLDSPTFRRSMREFMSDHQRHIQELSPIVMQMGDEPPTQGDVKSLLTKGKVLLGQITGDKGILSAMLSNEEDTNEAYEQTLLRDDTALNVRDVLQRGLSDERRHKAWIESALTQFRPLKDASYTSSQHRAL